MSFISLDLCPTRSYLPVILILCPFLLSSLLWSPPSSSLVISTASLIQALVPSMFSCLFFLWLSPNSSEVLENILLQEAFPHYPVGTPLLLYFGFTLRVSFRRLCAGISIQCSNVKR